MTILASAALGLALAAVPGAPARAGDPPPTMTPVPAAPRSAPTDPEQLIDALRSRAVEEQSPAGPDIVVNPATGKREQRIPKAPQYYVVRDRLYNAVLPTKLSGGGVPILHQDDKYYYVAAPADPGAKPPVEKDPKDEAKLSEPSPEEGLSYLIELAAQEAEVVTPPQSASPRLRLEEESDGLPQTGMWRENFTLGDLDGDGRPEIIAPPPRLSGLQLQVFKRTAKGWQQVEPTFESPEQIGFEYGGVAAGDMDGDKRVDLVFGHHGGGPAIAYNKGGLKFRIESRGLPRAMSTRSIVLDDLDHDGRLDIMALSDVPEFMEVRRRETEGDTMARQPRQDGYVPGYDLRAFFNRGDHFEESREGLDGACFGYSMSLAAAPVDKGAPLAVTSCRYRFLDKYLWEYDRTEKTFKSVAGELTEKWAYPIGTAVGVYQRHPAAVISYIKTGPQGGTREISGHGITLFYRDGGAWKSRRIWKAVETAVSSSGLAMADMDGDGLDDVVFADDKVQKVRIFFQRKDGSFEEMAADQLASYANHATSVRLADVDGDGRKDVVVMSQFLTGDASRSGGIKVFRNLPASSRTTARQPKKSDADPMVRKHNVSKKP